MYERSTLKLSTFLSIHICMHACTYVHVGKIKSYLMQDFKYFRLY